MLFNLFQIPKMLLGKTHRNKDKKEETKELYKTFLEIHKSCSAKNATPRQYMNFLNTYLSVYEKKRERVEEKQKHLQVSRY